MVSVVVPVYNVEKYLDQCVKSVLNQTYRDYELILIDDGSTDSSGMICDKYTEDSRVRVVHKTNAGLGMARNSGIEIARGDYVTFLDSDDYLGKDALGILMNSVERDNADTVLGGYSRVLDSGTVIFSEKPELKYYNSANEVHAGFFPKLMGSLPQKKDSFRPSVWNAVYSMCIIREHNIRFPSEREYIAEDIIFDIDYYRFAQKVAVVPSSEYFYRVTPGSLTQKYKEDRFSKVVFLYHEIFRKLEENAKNKEECILRAKRQFFVYVKLCIVQESISVSHQSLKKALKNISSICKNEFCSTVIDQYPTSELGIAQRSFLFMVKNHMSVILYLMLCFRKKEKKGKA